MLSRDIMTDAKDQAAENSLSNGDPHKSIPVGFTVSTCAFLANTHARWDLTPSLHCFKV